MGIDCTLLVIDGKTSDWGFSHTLLPLSREYDTFNHIKDCCIENVPASFKLNSYFGRGADGERKYGSVTEDCYGQPLRWGRAAKFVEAMKTSESSKCIAARAYLRELSPDTLVVPYWH